MLCVVLKLHDCTRSWRNVQPCIILLNTHWIHKVMERRSRWLEPDTMFPTNKFCLGDPTRVPGQTIIKLSLWLDFVCCMLLSSGWLSWASQVSRYLFVFTSARSVSFLLEPGSSTIPLLYYRRIPCWASLLRTCRILSHRWSRSSCFRSSQANCCSVCWEIRRAIRNGDGVAALSSWFWSPACQCCLPSWCPADAPRQWSVCCPRKRGGCIDLTFFATPAV